MPIFTPSPLPQQRRPPPLVPSFAQSVGSVGSAAGTSTAAAIAPFGTGSSAGVATATAVGASLAAATGTAAGTSTAVATASNIFPLAVSSDGHYLQQNDGTPFLICAQTTWSLAVDIPLSDINNFLTTITGQGFNGVMMNVIEHHYTTVKPPKERGGNLPFTKTLDGSTFTGSPNGTTGTNGTQGQFASDNYANINNQAPDCTFINNTYWQAVETILDACLAHNVAVFVWAGYLGFHANDEGWMSEMVAWDAVTGAGGFTGQPWANGTKSKMWNYGAWLANRWKSYPHLIWVMGGDYGSNSQTLDTQQMSAVNNLMAGLKSVAGQGSTLFTAHWDRPAIATDTTLAAGAFDLNLAYCDEAVAELTRRGYARSPTIPTFLGEYFYEDDLFGGSTPYRKYVYWGFLGGIAGGFFGNEQLWRFDDGSPGTDYTTIEATTATLDAQRQFAFWKARPWWRLKPNGLGGIGTLITAGGGTASPQSTTYVAAAATSLGDLLLAYLPPDHTGSVTVDMTKLSATVQARWFDPSNATFTTIGGINNSGTHAFTTTGNNNAGAADWLLVLETVAGTAAGTSTATAVGAALASTVGTTAGSSTATAVSQSTAASTGSSTGSSTATAVGAAVTAGVGTSTGAATASAIGQATTDGIATSSASSTATAVGQSTATGVGAATGSATATAVGQAIAAGVGSATGSATAVGVGQSPGAADGIATGSATATAVGASIAATSGSTAGTSTASATSLAIATAAGATAGSSAGSAVGQSLATTTGSVAGSSTAVAEGAALAAGTGAAAGTATATAVGDGPSAGQGTAAAAGTATATAVGASIGSGTGTAAGTSTATGVGASIGMIVGDAPITVADDQVAATGGAIVGAASITVADDQVAAAGSVEIDGQAAISLADDVLSSTNALHHHTYGTAKQAALSRTRRITLIVRK